MLEVCAGPEFFMCPDLGCQIFPEWPNSISDYVQQYVIYLEEYSQRSGSVKKRNNMAGWRWEKNEDMGRSLVTPGVD